MGAGYLLSVLERVSGAFPDVPLEQVIGLLGEALGARGVLVLRYRPSRRTLEAVASWGISLTDFPSLLVEEGEAGFSRDVVVVHGDAHPHGPFLRVLGERLGVQTGVMVPLWVGDTYLGALALAFAERRALSKEERALLIGAVAPRVALYLYHRGVREGEIGPRPQAEALLAVARAGLTHAPLREVLHALARQIHRAIRADRVVIRLWNEKERALDLWACAPPLLVATLRPRHRLGEATFSLRVFQEGRTIVLPDISADPVVRSTFASPILSTMGTPIPGRNGPLGVVHVDWTTRHTPPPEEQTLLEMAAQVAGEAIGKAQAFEGEQEARRWAEALARTLEAAVTPGPLPQVLQGVLERMAAYWGAQGGVVRILDRCANTLVVAASLGYSRDGLMPLPADGSGGGISPVIFRTREPGVFRIDALTRARSSVVRHGYRTLLGAPLEAQGEAIGVIHLDFREEQEFSPEDLYRFSLMVKQVSQVVERAWLYEEARRHTEALRFQATILEHVSDAVVATDTEGRVRYWGAGAAKTLTIPSTHALGHPVWALLGWQEEEWREGAQQVWATGAPVVKVVCCSPASGPSRWFDLVISPWRDSEGQLIGFILVGRDTTPVRQMEMHLLRLEKLRALGQMAAGVAHDFNNCLAVILGQAELTLMDQALTPRQRQALEAIRRTATDGAQVVRRLAAFAHTTAMGQPEPVKVEEVCREAVESTRFAWEERAARQGITIACSLDLPEGIPPASCTAAELREVLINLILNAVDAMPQGGTLSISCYTQGDGVCIAVKDTGTGIPPEVRPRLFEPFFTTKGPRGTGLGLAVSHSIVRRYGGDIQVETEVGKGSTFTVRLPIAQPQPPASAGGPGTLSPSLRLLVVEDDPAVAEVLEEMLTTLGHRPRVFRDPAKALEELAKEKWDAVLTDLAMPGMTGWEVAAAVWQKRPEVPLLLLTGYGDHISPEEVKAKGIRGVVGKPVSMQGLAEALRAIVEGGGGGKQIQ
jgi:two-component system cell cycle sensor histidine kinase/response regulator CckA